MIETSKITHISEWRKIADLPSSESKHRALDAKYGASGIYQVATESDIDKIGDELVHGDIGYIGKSSNIHDRTYKIRQTANSKSNSQSHGAGVYIRQKEDLNVDTCYVRILYTAEDDTSFMEAAFHNAMTSQFGYKFKWREASGGRDGDYTNATILVDKLNNEDRRNLIRYIEEVIKNELLAEFMSG
jgi:hypothetical protein